MDTNQFQRLEEIAPIARSIGWGAADILRSYYRGEANLNVNENKKDGPVTAADLDSNHYILEQLQAALGTEEFGYLSEETYQGTTPLPQSWVWIIDPLDGTRDFIDKTGEYAVHIALTYQNRPVLAIVAIPETEKLYFAIKNKGTFVETRDGKIEQLRVSDRKSPEQLYLVASRTHRDERFQQLLNRLPFQ